MDIYHSGTLGQTAEEHISLETLQSWVWLIGGEVGTLERLWNEGFGDRVQRFFFFTKPLV